LGRFIGRDPIGYIDSFGLYAGNLVPNHLDPSGREVEAYEGEIVSVFLGGKAGGAANRLPWLAKLFLGTIAHTIIENDWNSTGRQGTGFLDKAMSEHWRYWGVPAESSVRPDMGDAIDPCKHLFYEIKSGTESGLSAARRDLSFYNNTFNPPATPYHVQSKNGSRWPLTTRSLPILVTTNSLISLEFWSAEPGVVLYRYVEGRLPMPVPVPLPIPSPVPNPVPVPVPRYDPDIKNQLDWFFLFGALLPVGVGAGAIAGPGIISAVPTWTLPVTTPILIPIIR
jgi:hypothetical protein